MEIGDFFKSATHAKPVNPKPVDIVMRTSNDVLPGGGSNPKGREIVVRARVAFAALTGDEAQEARFDAREYLKRRFVDPKTKMPLQMDEIDLGCETRFQELWRCVRTWDPMTKQVGGRFFPEVSSVREFLGPEESLRVYREYIKYVEVEHPAEVPEETFPSADRGSEAVAAGASR